MKPVVLVTNDDGIQAPGLRALAEALQEVAMVYVVAPDRERSATGHAITFQHPLRAEEMDWEGILAWAVNGTPSDCVKLGIEELLPQRPELVFSGINAGANLGTDILYSGTVSAAVEGVIYCIPSLAVSVASFEAQTEDFQAAAAFARRVFQQLQRHPLPDQTILNINLPRGANAETKVKVTRLGTRRYCNVFDRRVDPRGRTYYWLGGEVVDEGEEEGTDSAAIKAGYISLTPVHFDLTRYDLLQELAEWEW